MIPWLALPPDVLAWGLHSGVSVALLGLAALFALRVHRTASVHWIHALVVNVLLASLALPTLAAFYQWRPAAPSVVAMPASVGTSEISEQPPTYAQADQNAVRWQPRSSPRATPRLAADWIPQRTLRAILSAAALVWLTGGAVMLIQTILWLTQQRSLLARAQEIEEHRAGRLIEDTSVELGNRGRVRLLSLDNAPWPFTVGVWRPVVVVPADLLDDDHSRLVAALTHELEHVRRRDYAVLLLQRAYAIAFWWNPCRAYFDDLLEVARERICDDAVLVLQGDGRGLAEYLVQALESHSRLPAWNALGLGAGDGQAIQSRVRHLVNGDTLMFRNRLLHVATLSAAILVSAFALAQMSHARPMDLIWTDTFAEKILRAPIDGSGPVTVLYDRTDYPGSPNAIRPQSVDVDGEFVYWSDFLTNEILRAPLDGNGPVELLFTSPGLQPYGLDVKNEFVYWTDMASNQVLRGANDGSGSAFELYSVSDYPGPPPASSTPRTVAVGEDHVYWGDGNANRVLRGPVDGAGVVTELFNIDDYPPGSTPSPSGMALRGQSLYWTDILSDVILHGAADGSGSPTVLYGSGDYPGSPSSISPYGMQIEGEFLYWTDSTTDQILTAPIDGSGPVSVLYDSGDYPGPPSSSYAMRGIAIVPAAVPEPGGMSLLALGGILVVRVGRRRRDAAVGRGSDAF